MVRLKNVHSRLNVLIPQGRSISFDVLSPYGMGSEKVFVSQERASGFPEKGADLRGSPGTSGEVWGTSWRSLGNFWGTSGLLLSSAVRELPGKSPKTSGEVWGTSGEVRGLPRSSGEHDSLPATRQICLQWGLWRKGALRFSTPGTQFWTREDTGNSQRKPGRS